MSPVKGWEAQLHGAMIGDSKDWNGSLEVPHFQPNLREKQGYQWELSPVSDGRSLARLKPCRAACQLAGAWRWHELGHKARPFPHPHQVAFADEPHRLEALAPSLNVLQVRLQRQYRCRQYRAVQSGDGGLQPPPSAPCQ